MFAGRPGRATETVAAIGLLALAAVPPADAAPPQLGLPIDCTPGKDCWIIQYVDTDPGPGRLDYMCGWLSYDDATGTDLAVPDIAAMNRGVAVLAAAGGTVVGTRDGMDDVDVNTIGREALEGKDCGNGVGIDHGDGWFTQYCHLRRKSVAVRSGETVTAGQRLGLVGMSGNTEFPHLEIVVRHNDRPVDPFVGLERSSDCGPGPAPLWRPDVLDRLSYRSAILVNAGFAAATPRLEAVRDGLYDRTLFSPEAAALVLWLDAYWPRPEDRIRLRIIGPDGTDLVDSTTEVTRTVPRDMFYAGVRYRGEPWPAGIYRGEATLSRADGPIGREEHTVTRTIEVR